jgi:hypothetical protein
MKKSFLSLTLCCLLSVSFAQKKTLPEGTVLKVVLTESLSSRDAKVGDIVHFKVSEPVKVNEVVVIDSNTTVLGEVIEAERSRSLGRAGKLDFSISSVKTADGQNVKLRVTSKKMTGQKTTGGVVAAAIIFTPIALFIKGKNVTIDEGKEFLVYTDEDHEIDIK